MQQQQPRHGLLLLLLLRIPLSLKSLPRSRYLSHALFEAPSPSPPRRFPSSSDAFHPSRPTPHDAAFGNFTHDIYTGSSRLRPDGMKICTDWWISCFKNSDKSYESLSALLRKPELWFAAYQKVCLEVTGAFAPQSAQDRTLIYNLQILSDAVWSGEFTWGGYGKIYIISPKEKDCLDEMGSTRRQKYLSRIHASPIFQDRLVQEVLLMILEPIYEARFSPKSHAFRPGRNAQTALRVIRRSFPGYIWYFKGDVSSSLDSVKSGLLMRSMFHAIKDKRVLRLIKAGILTEPPPPLPKPPKPKNKKEWKKKLLDEGPKPDPYWLESFFGFAPKEVERIPKWGSCGVLSSLLLNIYFDQLDIWMNKRIKEFLKPSSSDTIWNNTEEVVTEGDSFVQFVPAAPGVVKTRRMDYIRYGTQFLVAIRGSRYEAAEMRKEILEFCKNDLHLVVNPEESKLTHVKKGIMFLDHVISRRVVQPMVRRTTPQGKIIQQKVLGSVLSMSVSMEACMAHFRKTGFLKGNIDAQPCFRLFHAPQSISNAQINKMLEFLAEWFRYADNRKRASNFCQYILRSSLAKLYAAKYKLRSRAQVYKVGSGDLSLPIKDKKGLSEHYKRMLRKGFVEGEIPGIEYRKVSKAPDVDLTPLPRNWMPEHEIILRELAYMLRPECQEDQTQQLRKTPTFSPQENMSHILWSFFKGFYHIKRDIDALLVDNTSDRDDADLEVTDTQKYGIEELAAESDSLAQGAGG